MTREKPSAGRDRGTSASEDDALWESVTRSVQPIARRGLLPDSAKHGELSGDGKGAKGSGTAAPATQKQPLREPIDLSEFSIGGRRGDAVSNPAAGRPPVLTSRQSPAHHPPAGLSHGDTPGVDRRTSEKFRRGLMPIEATLDLHGHTQATGHQALVSFIRAHQAAGRRCVLVITGKGLKEDWSVGVLRAALPEWLNAPELRKLVLAFTYAQPHHGGSGAVYLLLRRNRQG